MKPTMLRNVIGTVAGLVVVAVLGQSLIMWRQMAVMDVRLAAIEGTLARMESSIYGPVR